MAVDGFGLVIEAFLLALASLAGATIGATWALRPPKPKQPEPAPVIRADWQHDAMDARRDARLRLYQEGQ